MTFAVQFVKQNYLREDTLQNYRRFRCSLGNQGFQIQRNCTVFETISLRQPHPKWRYHRRMAAKKVWELEKEAYPIFQPSAKNDGKSGY